MTEIIRGIWIGDLNCKTDSFLKKYKIDKVLNCATNFEVDENLDENYKYKSRINNFLEKTSDLLLDVHYLNNNKCLIVCKTGKRISVYVVANYLSKTCKITMERALEIVKTKMIL